MNSSRIDGVLVGKDYLGRDAVAAAAMWGMLTVGFASPARADLRREVQSTTTGAAVTSRPAREKTGVSVCGPIKSLALGTGISHHQSVC